MGKLSAEDQATLDRLTAQRDAPDDDDDGAIWVRNADGHETRLTGKRADDWLARNGYSEAAGDASTQDAPLPAAGGKGRPAATGGKGRPPARKQAARTSSGATPPADTDVDDDDQGDDLDTDPPARTGRRSFF